MKIIEKIKRKKNFYLIKSSSIYLITNIIQKAIPFFLLPVFTYYLSKEDYGIISIYQVLLNIFMIFIGLNSHGAISVNFYKFNDKKRNMYNGNIFILVTFSFIFIFLICFFTSGFLSKKIKFPKNWIYIIPIISYLNYIILILLTNWRLREKSLNFGILQILIVILNTSFSLILIIKFKLLWKGRILGSFLSGFIIYLFSIIYLIKNNYINFKLNKKYIKDILFFGIPLIPHSLGGWIINATDKLFINSMIDVSTTGVYSVGFKLGMIIGIIGMSFNQAWSPHLFKTLSNINYFKKIKLVRFTYFVFFIYILLFLFLILTAPIYIKIFVSKNFYGSLKYISFISMGYLFNSMYFMVVNYIFFVKKTYYLSIITFSKAILNIILNYFFIKFFGAIGATYSTAISFFVGFILTWILSNKVYPMPWFDFKNIIFKRN